MNDKLYRHVLFKDLESYLRKEDYLGGYTTTEKNWIRKNIDALGVKEAMNLLDRQISGVKFGTYKELSKLVSNKELVPGFLYILTDFRTIYQSSIQIDGKFQSWGDLVNPSALYNIILIAYSESQFLKNVTILSDDENSLEWVVLYNFQSRTLDDGVQTKGEIIYLQDQNNNRANYDFKNIKHVNGYTFEKDGVEGSQFYIDNDLTNSFNISFKDISNHNKLSGTNVIISSPIDYLVGQINNVYINTSSLSLDSTSIKQIVTINNKYYLDYLDLETLTHQFYAIDTIQ